MAELSAYHRSIAETNRRAILDAAAALFLEAGYDRTSLAQVAEAAEVSKATLFKQFPTKAALFEATVLAAGDAGDGELEVTAGDPVDALVQLGTAYVDILTRPRIVGLMRAIIAESPRFPELAERTFDFGTLPVLRALRRHLADVGAGDVELAATQLLGMIANAVFWPRLVHGGTWSITDDEVRRQVREAAQTVAARHLAGSPAGRSH